MNAVRNKPDGPYDVLYAKVVFGAGFMIKKNMKYHPTGKKNCLIMYFNYF